MPNSTHNPNDPLRKDLDWYIANQADLVTQHNGKVLLIVDQKLVAAFDTMEAAYLTALKTYKPGSFTLQPCSPGADSYTLTLYSPRYQFVA